MVQLLSLRRSVPWSFAGARLYHQAYERGVKLIGATAHFVTPDLDEGPIIEQEVVRVDHARTPTELTATGREVECLALAHAVQESLTLSSAVSHAVAYPTIGCALWNGSFASSREGTP